MKYILSVDQSTQGTKAMLFNEQGELTARTDLPHRQIVNEKGWVEHDPLEILENTLQVCRAVINKADIPTSSICAMGVSNQRETVLVWDRETGKPLYNAIVWQCARAKDLCAELSEYADLVKYKTGLNLSPYFSAPKLRWIMDNVPAVREAAVADRLCCGTIDSWLIFHLTEEQAFKTDYSNASRTQLLNIHTLQWDEKLCGIYRVPLSSLPEVCMSDSVFGHTDLGGFLEAPVPICGVLGDSHGALLGQACLAPGQVKATYGTGSSVMMQTGSQLVESKDLVTSLAWGLDGKVEYVLEGNLNYTGATISWLKNDVKLIEGAAETEALACVANPADRCILVPAFTGLGAPYWDSEASAILCGMTRTTGKAEIVKAALESIGYQIADLLTLMEKDSGIPISQLRVDGGPTANRFLMQFQSDIAGCALWVPPLQELSGMGAAYAAGFAVGLYPRKDIFRHIHYQVYNPLKTDNWRTQKQALWQSAIRQTMLHS